MDRRLIRPDSMEEALSERQRYGSDAMPIAGGQSLLVLLRNKLIDPKILIDLERLAELRGLQRQANAISIGAMTTIFTLASSADVEKAAPLGQAAAKVGSTAIRNLGTIGGNICHNELGADPPPSLLVLNAVAELRRKEGTRRVPLGEFFRSYFETVVAPEELLCRIEVPVLPNGAAGIYLKHAISSEDLAIASVAVVVIPDGNKGGAAREVRIGLGGVAPVPFRAAKAERTLAGAVLKDEAIREAAEIASSEADPMTDPHASADYRRKMVKVLVRRAIVAAKQQLERKDNGKA